jgi:magnesium-transporting ATPase (P-type)
MAEAPLTAIQFLWVNMIMDTLAALALATEDPKPELLDRPPYRKGEYIISVTMAKHILGQTFFQIGILFAFVFGASKFVPEYWQDDYPEQDGTAVLLLFPDKNHDYWTQVGVDPAILAVHANPKYRDWDGKYVLDGTPTGFDGNPAYYPLKDESYSRHLTTVFNIFVFFQICNMICSRKIQDQLNVFDGIFGNWLFIVIWLVIVGGQAIMVSLAGRVMNCHTNGLTGTQWLITTLPSLSAFLFNFILKFVPDSLCEALPLGDEDPENVARAKAEFAELRATSKQGKK